MSEKKSNIKKTLITDTTLRDAHQSILATRMRTEDMLPILEQMDNIGFWSMEVWGGATFDIMLRYLKENPWERLKNIKKVLKNTPTQMLLRGQNLLGYRHYSDDVLKMFIAKASDNGMDIFRIFDALNDLRNVEIAVKEVKRVGKHAEGAISYTISPVHKIENFVNLAVKFEEMGCDTICIKDMAGLLAPSVAYDLVQKIKKVVKVPLHLHTHDTTGLGGLSVLKAIEAGCDIVDAAISPLASGTSQPPIEVIVAALQGTEHDTALDMKQLREIANYFRKIRKKYGKFESEFTGINVDMLISQVPGGMISNLASQLKDQGAIDRFDEVIAEVPRVRQDMGFPPLVTPTSQIVGTQATLNVLTGERYKVITNETKNYLKGMYGKPVAAINEEVRRKAVGSEKIIDCRPADLLPPEMDALTKEIGDLAENVEDVLSYAMFPQIAKEFFEERKSGNLKPESLDYENSSQVKQAPHLAPSEFNITVHGETYHVVVEGSGHKSQSDVRPFYIKIDGRPEEALVESLVEVMPSVDGQVKLVSSKGSSRPKASGKGDVTTAMPGRVIKLNVKEGSQVKAGDTILIVEAMKMENQVHTPIDGVIKKVYVKEGDNVNPDETLVVVE